MTQVELADGDKDADSTLSIAFVNALKLAARKKDLREGRRIHSEICYSELSANNLHVGNALLNMYAKCGALGKAQQVLGELLVQDVVSWTIMIAGCTQQGNGKEALHCFQRMVADGLIPNAYTYACTLKACGITQDIKSGKKIHEEVASRGLLKEDIVLGSAVIDMYSKCGALVEARKALESLPFRSVACWSTLIAGYNRSGKGKEALDCFWQMLRDGISPDTITYVCALKACGITQNAQMGEKVHNQIITEGLLKNNGILGCALVDMYAECGELIKAQKAFDELLIRNVSAWNALIWGYVRQGYNDKPFECFKQMQKEGLSADAITYTCILKGCRNSYNVDIGKKVHDEILGQGLLKRDDMLGTALVDMYAQCGLLYKAHNVFDELPVQSVASWNALIGGYTQHGHGEEALSCFHRMQSKSLSPNVITYVCILKACSITQDANMGRKLHDNIVSQGLLKENIVLGVALVDMYAKCGLPVTARIVLDELSLGSVFAWSAVIVGYAQQAKVQKALNCFKEMQSEGFSPDAVSWNALIGCYSQEGLAKESLTCFQCMQEKGSIPNAVTFVNVLNACSHSGLVDEGQICFSTMRESYGIVPNKDHYACIVDMFGRAKLFKNAMQMITVMPFPDYLPCWLALLDACRERAHVKLATLAFEYARQLDEGKVATYVLMSNIYVTAVI